MEGRHPESLRDFLLFDRLIRDTLLRLYLTSPRSLLLWSVFISESYAKTRHSLVLKRACSRLA